MDLELTDRQKMTRDMVRDFAERELAPIAAETDRDEVFPEEAIGKMGELGLMGIMIPTEYGGSGMDAVTYAVVVEEISRKCASTGTITSVHNSFPGWMILKYGNEEQRRKYLPDISSGRKLGAFAGTEPNAGSDLGAITTTAVLKGDRYILNGTKTFITAGPICDMAIVFAITDKEAGTRGISTFIVESGYKGFTSGPPMEKMGIRGSLTSELIFEDMEVPRENLLGKEGDGFKMALSALDGGRIGIASQAVGIAQAALDESIAYSKKRVQFGKPIASFQAIQWMIAEMATRIEAARFLVYKAAVMKDGGKRFSKEAAMAKLFASETAVWCTNRAIQVHGGNGYMREYTVERLYRDAKITEIYEGTSEVMKMVIAGSLLK